jgi:hypothetical protein
MEQDQLLVAVEHLAKGPRHPFSDPLDPALPRVAAGCYTIWERDGGYIYAGMAGRGLTADAIRAARATGRSRITGLRDRLNAHRNGRRSGDQFSVYVFDRIILGSLNQEQIRAAGEGTRRLDDDVQHHIRANLSYRWYETDDGANAVVLETTLVTQGLLGSLTLLNPRKVEEA